MTPRLGSIVTILYAGGAAEEGATLSHPHPSWCWSGYPTGTQDFGSKGPCALRMVMPSWFCPM